MYAIIHQGLFMHISSSKSEKAKCYMQVFAFRRRYMQNMQRWWAINDKFSMSEPIRTMRVVLL